MVFTESSYRNSTHSSSSTLSRLTPSSDCWSLFLELHKKFRRVLRRSLDGEKIHLHDLKLCLDLFLMEQQDMPDCTLHTHHVETLVLVHRHAGEMKAVMSPDCILEMQAWKNAFSRNKDNRTFQRNIGKKARPHHSRSMAPKLFLTNAQVQELYGGCTETHIEHSSTSVTSTEQSSADSNFEVRLKDCTDKYQLGERLFVLISEKYRFPTLAGKITGMLLALEFDELSNLLKSPRELFGRVMEALHVLRQQEQLQSNSRSELDSSDRETNSESESATDNLQSDFDDSVEIEDIESDSEDGWSQYQGREWGLDEDL